VNLKSGLINEDGLKNVETKELLDNFGVWWLAKKNGQANVQTQGAWATQTNNNTKNNHHQ